MRHDPILASIRLPAGTDGHNVPRVFTVEGGLHYLVGNPTPHFTLTYTAHRVGFPDQCYSGGAGHDTIRLHFGDRFDDLAALHLSDIDGIPLHAEANGWYYLAGALGGAGERFHAGNGDSQHWRPDGTFDGFRPSTPDEALAAFARHCRITVEEAATIRDACRDEHANNPDGWAAARELMGLRLYDMRPRWRAEADAAIARHGLRVFGHPWTGVQLHPPSRFTGAEYPAHRDGAFPNLGCCNAGAIAEAAADDPGEAAEPALHPAATLTGGTIPPHYAGAYPRLSCCGGPVALAAGL